MSELFGKLVEVALLAAVLIYYVQRWWIFPDRDAQSTRKLSLIAVAAMAGIPYAIHVIQMVRLDLRFAKRLDAMAARVMAGEVVKASEL